MAFSINPVFAFCATYSQQGLGSSRQEASFIASNKNQREIRQLRQKHGNRIQFDNAQIKCSGSDPVRCLVIQQYCVADARGGRGGVDDDCPGDSVRDRRGRCVKEADDNECPANTVRDRRGRCIAVVDDDCPGDSVRDRRGRCVKEEDDPVPANPCTAGRLFSQSLEICHCPELSPVWTGRRCVPANVDDGASNNQIIERCNRLNTECEGGLRGACRALRTYCDRG
jgi:hypothetical protein